MKGTIFNSAALLATAVLNVVPLAAPATAQQRVRQVIVFGNDRCPQGSGDEIVVCARRPESDRYRLPENARGPADVSPERRSWAARQRSLQNVGRTGTDSCSPVGPGGQTGCLQRMIDANEGDEAANAPYNTPQ